ncbi:MAG: DUF4394 domain-containing protein, partial [Sphingomonadaceae bacterium]
MKSYRTLGAALLAAFAPVSLAHAEQLAGLTTNQRIVTFDSATPGTIISNFAISGLSAGDQLVGIDLRPVNSLIYGIAQTGRVYTLSTSGMASLASTMSVAPVGGRFGFDFNP